MANLTHSLNVLSDGSITSNTSTPSGDVFGMALDPWMVDYGKNVFIVNSIPAGINGIPAVQQMPQPPAGYTPVLITPALSAWWYNVMAEAVPTNHDQLVHILLNLTLWNKAFTNKTGWNSNPRRNEYWSGNGAGYKEDLGLLYCWSAGSTYKIIGSARISGEDCYKIAVMDAFDPATRNITYKGNEHLFTIATVDAREPNAPHGFRRDAFDDPYNYSTQKWNSVIVPLLVNHDTHLYIQKKYIKILPAGAQVPQYPYGWQ